MATLASGVGSELQGDQAKAYRHSPDAAGGCSPLETCGAGLNEIQNSLPSSPIEAIPMDEGPSDVIVSDSNNSNDSLRPYPFYYYIDHSTDVDPDPFAPVTPPGRVPNFPAKMHAILSREDLADIVCWMPHGRAWRILKPREFEIRIIPVYFEHAKFSSFIRQANGWDFRRITKGPDRNCYYNPYFLRGLPFLCKYLRRPGIAKKVTADPDHEPDLYRISDAHPVPEKYDDDSVLLQCTLEGGPKARMPIYTGFLSPNAPKLDDFRLPQHENTNQKIQAKVCDSDLTPRDQEVLSAFQHSLEAACESKAGRETSAPLITSMAAPIQQTQLPALMHNVASSLPVPLPATQTLPSVMANVMQPAAVNSNATPPNLLSTLAAANQLAFASHHQPSVMMPTSHLPFSSGFAQAMMQQPQFPPSVFSSMFQATASSNFAAGFAAASALSEQNFHQMLASFSANIAHLQPQLPTPSGQNAGSGNDTGIAQGKKNPD